MLAAGTLSQTSFSAITFGLAVMAPVLRDEFDLSLGQIGVVLSAAWLGSTLTLLPWGLAADRFGERVVLALGLFGAARLPRGSGLCADVPRRLYVLLAFAGAAGASVNSASGRAVMLWFAPSERGLALGDPADGDPARRADRRHSSFRTSRRVRGSGERSCSSRRSRRWAGSSGCS